MKNYVFIISTRGDRTNIMANFKVISKEDFIKYVKEQGLGKLGRWYGDNFRYAYIGGTADNLKYMSLKEFDEVFEPTTFTPEEITKIFRKEISEVYGEHKERKLLKKIPSKDLVVGGVYLKADGAKEIYLGKLERIFYQDGKHIETEVGNGWRYYLDHHKDDAEGIMGNADILKSNRPVVSFTGTILKLPKETVKELKPHYYDRRLYKTVTKSLA